MGARASQRLLAEWLKGSQAIAYFNAVAC